MRSRKNKISAVFLAVAVLITILPTPKAEAALESFNKTFTGNIESKINTDPEIDSIPVSFTADFDTLLYKIKTQYQPELGKLCSILATDVYSNTRVTIDNNQNSPTSPSDDTAIYKAMGMEDIELTSFKSQDFEKDSDDITKFVCSHKAFTYGNKKKEVIIVAIEGTDGTEEQWRSNMDVGADTEDYKNLTGDHPEWTNKEEHKGFNVTYNRVSGKVKEYIESKVDTNAEKVILITGHSRGGALSNLLGREYEDNQEFTSFTYTFAAPNTTTSSNAGKYKTIFNIINTRDIIPTFPLEEWGFKTYGTSLKVDMSAGSNWKDTTGKDNYVNFDVENTVSNFRKVSKSREDYYKIATGNEEEGTRSSISEAILKGIREDFVNWINANAKGTVRIGDITGNGPFEFKINIMPAFTTSVIAKLASSDQGSQLATMAILTLAGLNDGSISKYIAPVINMIDGYMNNSVVCGHCMYAYYGAATKVEYHTHNFADPVIEQEGESFTVTYTCKDEDDTHVITPDVTKTVTKEATLTEAGRAEYVLTYIFNGQEYTKKTEATIPKLEAKNFIDRIKQGDIPTIVITAVIALAILAILRFAIKLIKR